MKKRSVIIVIVLCIAMCVALVELTSDLAHAANIASAKLPYAKGQNFIVTQGYDTPPTHIKKDLYALDFTQNGCDAYGKAAVAAAPGKVMFLSQEGYNGGYGTELIIDHGNNIVSRYAHMIPGSITLASSGAPIQQGQPIGLVGDTGLVAGAACANHPGTHLHFAMDTVNSDGTFSAYDPEPISGYTNMTVGKWYLSDNGDDVESVTTSSAQGEVLGVDETATTTDVPVVKMSSLSPSSSSAQTNSVGLVGGVSSVSVVINTVPASVQVITASSSTLDASTSTVEASSSSTATSSLSVASSSGILFQQSDDDVVSHASWYDDNWFDLGNGFSGTLNVLTLEGRISDPDYLATQVSLQEFKDKNYTAMVQEFPISVNAPFTFTMATATFSGLSIPLKPYFYYRVATMQDWQNRSVILAGTTSTVTGTYMWDGFVPTVGRVEATSSFFPFMTMEGAFSTSTLLPPPLTTPTTLSENFDKLTMQLNLAWGTSTDPDWPANPLHYEMNYSTSTQLSDAGWIVPGPIPLATGNTYLVGIRAADDYGDVSVPATATWNFPAGFAPYILSPGLGYAYQSFTVPSTSTLQSIQLFTTHLQSGAPYASSITCSLRLFDNYNASSLGVTPADNNFNGRSCEGTPTYLFTSSPLILHPDHQYQWVFTADTGNPSTGASVQFYGTATDSAGGLFGDPSLVNARFIVTGDTGIVFSN